MRWFTLMLIGGLVLAVSSPANAFMFDVAYNGPITIHLTNWDEGTLYYNLAQGVVYTDAQLHALPTANPGGGLPYRSLGVNAYNLVGDPNALNGSDTWGIFKVDQIQNSYSATLWSDGGLGGDQILAIFYGERDTYLKETPLGGGMYTQDIHGKDMHIAFFEKNPSNFSSAPGPGGGTGYPSGGIYPTVTDGTLIWTMNSVPGYDIGFPSDEFFDTYTSGAGVNSSVGHLMADMGSVPLYGTGPLNPMLDTNSIDAFLGLSKVDVAISFTASSDPTQYPDLGSWLLESKDPMNANIVPEPVTMVLVALGGLGVLFGRKRK